MPGDAFLAALRRLSAATDKPLAVCVQGDRLHVFVTNRILGQKVSSRVPPSAAVAEVDFLPELDGILKASDALGIKLHAPRAHHENGQRLVAHEVYAHMGRPAHAL